jgi:23S rRNA (uracil1939-C5)-methyltransferase
VHLRNTRNNGLESCFHRLRSPELVTVTECPASDALAWDLAQRTVELLHDLPHDAWDPDFAPNGLLRSVLVRSTTIGECYLVLVARDPFVPGFERLFPALHDAGATTIALNGNNGEFSQLLGPETTVLSGPPRIAERLGSTTYLLSPGAFFQTSPEGAFQIVQLVLDWLAPTTRDDVADLYCGGGLLTLPLAQRARSAFGVELSRTAVRDAEAAAVQNGLRNVRFASGHVEAWLRTCGRGDVPRPSLVALDPPRTGLTPEGIAGLGQLQPKRIAYVSCDPQALQRDLRELREVGFRLVRAVPVDMFPQTCHLESVAMLERLP